MTERTVWICDVCGARVEDNSGRPGWIWIGRAALGIENISIHPAKPVPVAEPAHLCSAECAGQWFERRLLNAGARGISLTPRQA